MISIDLRKLIKHVPNTITCCNLFSGCIAISAGFDGQYLLALIFILLAAVFDFFDGFAARMLHAYSPMGKELDSLADIVSFGVAPSAMVFSILYDCLPLDWHILSYLAFLIAIFSCLRLAKFNIDTRQTTSFIGLPVPANAIFWASFVYTSNNLFASIYWEYYIILIAIFCYLLVSEWPMFSLKMKNLKWEDNKIQFSFLITSALIVIVSRFSPGSLAMVVAVYVLFSIGSYISKKQ
jgi:CDP-diacylglycerol--serine O-phosphatidyltransferase